jgi:hypothetical protein
MPKKQRLVEYSFRPAQIVAMREAFQKACKAPQLADGASGLTEDVAWTILELSWGDESGPFVRRRLVQVISLTPARQASVP